MLDSLSSAVLSVLVSLVNLLPASPFRPYIGLLCTERIQNILAYVNWLLPIGTVVHIFSAWLAAIAVVYVFNVLITSMKIVL